jgi:hypothetical protein
MMGGSTTGGVGLGVAVAVGVGGVVVLVGLSGGLVVVVLVGFFGGLVVVLAGLVVDLRGTDVALPPPLPTETPSSLPLFSPKPVAVGATVELPGAPVVAITDPSVGITVPAVPVSAPARVELTRVPSAICFDGLPLWMAPLKLPVT